MKKRYFIAGTDAGVGKTKVSQMLLRSAAQRSLSTLGLKPVAAGAEQIGGQWRNSDALALMAASSVELDYAQVNPVLLKEPIAPLLSAVQEKKRLSVQTVSGYCRGTFMTAQADFVIVEGVGGWREPLNFNETMADVAKDLKLDVILVVGMKLGCLNHALLTAEAIERDGLKLAGWIANCIDPEMTLRNENIQTLQRMLRVPLIGVIPYLNEGEDAPEHWVNPAIFD